MSALAIPPSKGPFDVGDRFLKFEIRTLLGHGEHGWVYHGYDTFLDRHVAIKIIPGPADCGPDLRRRAQLEARMLCKLQHRNVVHVIDAGATAGGAVYVVMELLHGRTLREAIREYRQLSVAEVLSLGAQIADGLQAAHEQNTVHRALKPENVFIREGNAIKVLDFGVAQFLGAGAATARRDLLRGTILYMSPEHLQGLRVTARSDVYALGATLYEALAGCPPCLIGIQEPTIESLTFAQIHRMPPPLDVLTGSVPRFVAQSVQRMLAKAPTDRFETMAEVARVLRANWQRLAKDDPSASLTTRRLWQGFHSISPVSGAIRVSGAARQFRAEHDEISTPLDSSPEPPESEEPKLVVTRSPITLLQLLLCAVLLGTFIGVAVALIQAYPRPVAQYANVVVSSAGPSVSAPKTSAATTAEPAATPPSPAPRPLRLTRPIAKPAGSGPASGLSGAAEVEPATKPSAVPVAEPTASAARRPKAIYGSSDGD